MKNTLLILSLISIFSAFSVARASSIEPLSAVYKNHLIQKKLWDKNCPVDLSRLRLVTVDYYDFDGRLHHNGEIIVLDKLALSTKKIFDELAQQKFPFTSIKPSSDYNGDDEASMEANNTSAFNCRLNTTNPDEYSLHAYGAAIDINPKINPYMNFSTKQPGQALILPVNAADYMNRTSLASGSAEPVVYIFQKYGFIEWGGDWHNPIDYQHFQLPKNKVLKLAEEPKQ